MLPHPTEPTLTDQLFPYTTLSRATGQVPAVLENRLGAYGITPVAQKQAWRPPAGCTQRDISFHPWRKPCSRLIDHGQIEGRRRAAHRPSPGHTRPIGAPTRSDESRVGIDCVIRF